MTKSENCAKEKVSLHSKAIDVNEWNHLMKICWLAVCTNFSKGSTQQLEWTLISDFRSYPLLVISPVLIINSQSNSVLFSVGPQITIQFFLSCIENAVWHTSCDAIFFRLSEPVLLHTSVQPNRSSANSLPLHSYMTPEHSASSCHYTNRTNWRDFAVGQPGVTVSSKWWRREPT